MNTLANLPRLDRLVHLSRANVPPRREFRLLSGVAMLLWIGGAVAAVITMQLVFG